MNDFLDRKLSKRFRSFDYNGNGFIERSDFEMSVARLAEEFGHELESPARQRLLDLSLGLWDQYLQVADTNGDGRISEAEYKEAFALTLAICLSFGRLWISLTKMATVS
jgi:Ca2+-binding EF-hand superfamily protein